MAQNRLETCQWLITANYTFWSDFYCFTGSLSHDGFHPKFLPFESLLQFYQNFTIVLAPILGGNYARRTFLVIQVCSSFQS